MVLSSQVEIIFCVFDIFFCVYLQVEGEAREIGKEYADLGQQIPLSWSMD